MSHQNKSTNPKPPIPYPLGDSEDQKEPDKVSDAFGEYVTSAPVGLEARQSTQARRWIDRTSAPESAKLDLSPSRRIAGIKSSEEVWSFAVRHALLPHLEKAIQFVYECFPSAKAISLAHEVDLETPSESWISIDIRASGEVDELLENYLSFNRRMVREIPPDKSPKILLGLGGLEVNEQNLGGAVG